MIRRLIYMLAVLLLLAPAAGAEAVQVGLSMGNTDTARDIAVVQSIQSALEGGAYEVRLADAGGSLSRQAADIRDLVSGRPDYLLVSAVRSIGLGAAIESARQAGIPVILVDQFSTDVPTSDTLTRIGIDWSWAGATCADVLDRRFQGESASILEVQGTSGFSSTQEASKGFRAELGKCEGLQLAGVLIGGSDRQTTSQVLLDFIEEKGFCFDAVFAHGDEQALGVINALLSAAADEDIPIVCIGGADDAQRAMTAGKLFACVRVDDDPGAGIAQALGVHMAGGDVAPVQLSRGAVQYAGEGD